MNHTKKAVARIVSLSISAARSTAASLLVFVTAMLVLATLLPLTALAQTDPGPAPSSLIVKLVPGLTIDEQAAVFARNGGIETSTVPALRLHVIEVGAANIDVALANYWADSQVVRVEVNSVRQINGVPSDPQYGNQWFLPRIGWDQVFGTPADPNANVVVAILDTGIDATHPDLAANVVPGTSVLDGSNGMTDPSGHGTMVAGTVAAATDNATGIAGVAYAGVFLLPVTVLNADGIGQDSDIINGVVWATDRGARVILMAFSNPGFSASLQEAIDYAWSSNAVLVAANGNDAANAPTFPAGDRGVIGVSATDENDALAPFSNYGSSVFLAAPGTNILTTDIGSRYIAISGTSASAAIVAGAAAQMLANDPALTNGVVVGRLARTADPAGAQEETGNGRVNLARALLDAGTDFVQPAGAAPMGAGGPFVGPYRAAATNVGTNTSLNAIATPLSLGQANVSFSGLVSRKNASDPAIPAGGSVQLQVNSGSNCSGAATAIATATIDAAGHFSASFTAPSTAGSYSYQAQYQGASQGSGGNAINWQKSTSACQTITVNGPVATSLAVSSAVGTYSVTVNLTATLTSGGVGVSGKTISFTLNGSAAGSATTNASGLATLPNVSLAGTNAGTYPAGIGAVFAGDSGFQSSNGTAALTVAQAASSTTVTCAVSVTYTGSQQAPCSASVTGAGLSQTLTISYSNNVNAGTATASASYPGDANHTGSSDSKNFAINQASSTTTITCPPSVTYNGSPQAPCSASVTGAALSQSLTVTYSNNVNAGTANASATFAGDANHTGSNDSTTFAIDKAASSTSVSSSKNPATADDNVTFSATVTSGATGSVQFVIDNINYGPPVALAGGVATTALTNKTVGTHTVSATYLGDTNYSGSSGSLSPDQVVTAGEPAVLAFGTQPTDTQAGQAITPSVTVRILDAAGNLVTTDSSSVTIAISGGGVLQAGSTPTVAAVGGVATFGNLKPTKAGTFTLYATDATLAAADSTTFNVTPGAAVTFAFDVPASITAGESFDITVYASDTFGNIATGYTGAVHFSSSDPNATLPSDVQFIAADAGVKALPLSTILTTAGNQTITATDIAPSGVKGTSRSITVDAGNATVLVVTAPPAIETAGLPFAVTVEARDAYGNRATGYAGTLLFYISDPKADKLNDYTFGGTDQGFHEFSVTLHSAGQWTVKATDAAANIYGESGTITVQPGPPAKLAFKSQPGNTFVGVAIPSFAVEISDADDNVVDNAQGSVPITIGIGANPTHVATLNGAATVDAVDGVATFSGLMLDKAASGYTLVASSDPLEGATSDAFDVGKGTATLALGNLNQTYDGLPKSVTVTTTPAGLSGVSVTYSGSGSAPTNAGSYSVVASLANPDYEATNATGTLVVAKADATIVVTPYSLTYDGNAHTAIGTATGVKDETLSGLVLTGTTHTNAGDYAADPWTFTDATGNYKDASGTVHDAIKKAKATINVTPYNVTYDGNAHTASGTAMGVKGETLSGLVLTGTTHTNAGDYPTDAWTFTDASGNYQDDGGTVHDVITRANPTISVTPYNVTYDANPHTATGSATGVKGETLSGLVLTGTTHTNAADYPADAWTFTDATGNYNSLSGTIHDVIRKANATINVTPYNVTYDASAHTATGTATGVKSEPLTGLVLAGTTHTNAGDYQNDGWTFTDTTGNYNDGSGTVHDVITKADAAINVTPYNVTYDGNAHTATGTVSGVKGEALNGLALTGTMHTGAGNYPADAWTFTDATGNYNNTSGTVHDVITKANATISVTPYGVTYDGAAHAATGTATGIKGEALSGLVLASTTHTNAGDYPADSWTFTDATGNYNNMGGTVHDSIARANATISVTPYGVTYDGNAHAATGSATGVKGEALSGLVLTGTTHTNAADYAADPWAFTDGTGNYNNATGAVHDVIAKAPSAVSVTGGTFTYDATPHAASAIVSGAGAGIMQVVSWTYTPPGDSTVPTNAGAYAVSATYAGDVNHMDSHGSTGITITQAPSVTSVSVANAFFDGNAHGGSASVTGVGGLNQALTVGYAGVSGTTYGPVPMPPSAIGLYQATANFAGDANHLSSSDSKAFNIVGINIAGPTGPIAKGNPASLTVTLVGAASGYPIACTIDWTDGTVDHPSGTGTCSASHTYAGAGVYEPKVSVSSSALTGTSGGTVQYVVIYDASAGFVTGGGWIISPAGAYTANASLTGKANFGFVSKYQKGANVPTGNTEFQFQAANFNFKSTAYEWLVISGAAKAQYKGSGTINGVGDYGFMLTGIDGSASGGADKLRLKVWDKSTNATIYDNQINAPDTSDTADPSTALGGGSIVVHK